LAGLLLMAGATIHAGSDKGAAAPDYQLLFTGDILLGREVAREIEARRGMSPWVGLADELRKADFAMGNLEGSVGNASSCAAPLELCFADGPRFLHFLKEAGFTAIGIANNHSGDLGVQGRQQTRTALAAAGVVPIGTPESPAFVRLGEHTVAIVTLSLVPSRDGVVDAVPSWQIAQKLRLAHAIADWTIVYVHWGKELADWIVPYQRAQAEWLIAHGADVVIGAHPHVVQPSECVDGRPVFFSLGNNVFDQKYAETKRGLIADCRVTGDRLSCGSLATGTPMGSSYPHLLEKNAEAALTDCSVQAAQPIASGGWTLRAWTPQRQISSDRTILEGTSAGAHWRTRPGALVAAEFGTLVPGEPPMLFTLERHPSSMDTEDGPRPYVYEITASGLVARWRGSALAWPLLDARLLPGKDGRSYLCALHRGDSFLTSGSSLAQGTFAAPTHVLVYAWNGFGFSGFDDADLMDKCRQMFAE
jgi:Bacterial capsule synthesis protein PGA_cap